MQETAFDVVDGINWIDEREKDIPHEPTADGKDETDDRHDGFVMHFNHPGIAIHPLVDDSSPALKRGGW